MSAVTPVREPITIWISRGNEQKPEREAREGFLVPETTHSLGVHEHGPQDWVITHLPTGRRMQVAYTSRLTSRVAAIAVAQGIYRELVVLGADMASEDVESVVGALRGLPASSVRAFWERALS